MNELNNTVTSTGSYNNIPTSLTSNTSVVNIIEGLTITKDANQKNWSSGLLTYTITIKNETEQPYVEPIITDVIDTKLVEFVNDSVKINDIEATSEQSSYDEGTQTLTIKLDEIAKTSETIIKFSVKKKYNNFFILETCCKLLYNETHEITSNYVTVISPLNRFYNNNYTCDTPYFRI